MITEKNRERISKLATKEDITAEDYREVIKLINEGKPHTAEDELYLLSIDEILSMQIDLIFVKEGNYNFLEEEDK